jgi:hypothetical protein
VPAEDNGSDRDIDLVLLTGAGASREFGAGGSKVPLMGDWVEPLFMKLASEGLSEITGLERTMSGTAFESRLGEFLRERQAFDLIKRLIEPSLKLPGASSSQGWVEPWYTQVAGQLSRLDTLLAQSLYEQFATNIDPRAASQAYLGLFQSLGIAKGQSRVVLATTNYDLLAESALLESGWLPDWGQPPGALPGVRSESLAVDDLLGGIPRYVPVLHLHGRVGWFRRQDEIIYAQGNTTYDANFGSPVVVYPDPDKVYTAVPVIASIWQQFCQALDRAKRVLVLGHSLNDLAIVQQLSLRVHPRTRLALTVHCADDGTPESDPGSLNVRRLWESEFVGAALIPIQFGGDSDLSAQGFQNWLDRALGP